MKTNLNFITKSIPRDKAGLIPDLILAYSNQLKVKVSQADAIGLALQNEHERLIAK